MIFVLDVHVYCTRTVVHGLICYRSLHGRVLHVVRVIGNHFIHRTTCIILNIIIYMGYVRIVKGKYMIVNT